MRKMPIAHEKKRTLGRSVGRVVSLEHDEAVTVFLDTARRDGSESETKRARVEFDCICCARWAPET